MYIVNLYEREGKTYWPAGQYAFESKNRALACLAHQMAPGVCGVMHNHAVVFAYSGMSEHEVLHRIVGVRFLATGVEVQS